MTEKQELILQKFLEENNEEPTSKRNIKKWKNVVNFYLRRGSFDVDSNTRRICCGCGMRTTRRVIGNKKVNNSRLISLLRIYSIPEHKFDRPRVVSKVRVRRAVHIPLD